MRRRKLFSWQTGQEIRRLYVRRIVADYDQYATLVEAFASAALGHPRQPDLMLPRKEEQGVHFHCLRTVGGIVLEAERPLPIKNHIHS